MRKLKKNDIEQKILIKKFINYLIRNGKKSKSKKLLAKCCLYSDKLLKKKYIVKRDQQSKYSFSDDQKSFLVEGNKKGIDSNRVTLHYRLFNFFSKKIKYSFINENNKLFQKFGRWADTSCPDTSSAASAPLEVLTADLHKVSPSLSSTYTKCWAAHEAVDEDSPFGAAKVLMLANNRVSFVRGGCFGAVLSSEKKIEKWSSQSFESKSAQRTGQRESVTKSRLYFYYLGKIQKSLPLLSVMEQKAPDYLPLAAPTIQPFSRLSKKKGRLQNLKRKLTPINFFQKAIYRVRPLISLQKLRKGGRTRYIPRALSAKKGMFVALKWVLNSSIKKHGKNSTAGPVSQTLANELWDCFLEQGFSWQKKEELHKLGAANKAFIRYNWW